MRVSGFGEYIAESKDDNLMDAFYAADVERADCYADLFGSKEKGFNIEIMTEGRESAIVTSDENLFSDYDEAYSWAKSWVHEVHDYT